MFCINYCDIFNLDQKQERNLEMYIKMIEAMVQNKIDRIYFGSYFCDQYFLKFKGYNELIQYCRNKNIHMTLVVPVLSQNTLDIGKRRISEMYECAGNVVDEITVNDLGMLSYFSKCGNQKLNLGRLFLKNPRDCRIPEYTDSRVTPSFLSKLNQEFWKKQTLNCVELDPTNKILDASEIASMGIKLALHLPYCYMTTGKICKFASIHKQIEKKFRPNVNCQMECMYITDTYSGHVTSTNCDPTIYRIGRTLYFENNRVETVGKDLDRLIYFPIEEWRKCLYENLSSGK